MKIKKLFLSLVLIMTCFCWVSCGKKSDDGNLPKQKIDPTVSVYIDSDIKYYAGDKLKDIKLTLGDNSTAGKVSWKDKYQILQMGNNVCEYVFVPSDTETYNTVTKIINIQAERALDKPTLRVELKTEQIIYIGAKYSTIELVAISDAGDESTITWKNPNAIFKEGENICEWIFNPSNPEFRQMTGKITVVANTHQTLNEIEVVSNSKRVYKAFDKFDCSGLTLKKIYNAGKIEIVSGIDSNDCTFAYEHGSCFYRGDTFVTLTYLDCQFKVENIEVGYYIINKPQCSPISYTGYEEEFEIVNDEEERNYYTNSTVKGTDAGDYYMTLTIKDAYKDNCRWADDDALTTTITCKILKVDQTVTMSQTGGKYDKKLHTLTVDSDHKRDGEIYYSETALSLSNYTSGSKDAISKVNAGNYTIHYYIVGDKNHNDAKGSFVLTIEKATPTLSLENCYSIYTGSVVNYPSENVTISGVDEEVAKTGLSYSYYSVYEDESKVKLNSAPINPNMIGGAITDYIVVVNFAGNENYTACQGIAKLFIDNENNGLYAKSNESGFAFKDNIVIKTSDEDENGDVYTLTGSDRECINYLEFKRMPKDTNGVVGLSFEYKYASGNDSVLTGKLGKTDDGYVLICENGTKYAFTVSNNAESVTFTDAKLTLKKWEFPNYLGKYSAQTISGEDSEENKTSIRIFNDYGTIRFELKINLAVDPDDASGGEEVKETYLGVVECGFGTMAGNRQMGYMLSCFIISEGNYRGDGDTVSFTLYWDFGDDLEKDGLIIDNVNFKNNYESISKNENGNYIIYK